MGNYHYHYCYYAASLFFLFHKSYTSGVEAEKKKREVVPGLLSS